MNLCQINILDIIWWIIVFDLTSRPIDTFDTWNEKQQRCKFRSSNSAAVAWWILPTRRSYSRNFSPSFTEATGGMSGCHLLCNGVSCSHGAFFGSTDMIVLTIIVVYVYGKGTWATNSNKRFRRHFLFFQKWFWKWVRHEYRNDSPTQPSCFSCI